jgi:hypothetical protein
MDENGSRRRERRANSTPPKHSEGRIDFLLNSEEKILQSIAGRAPVPKILNEICTALDCQIGSIVSLISLPEDDVTSTSQMARNAALFGLHVFFSTGVFAESGEELGALEVYCSTPRDPVSDEVHLMERAACLAAISIECDIRKREMANWSIPKELPVRGTAQKSRARLN